AVAVGPEVHVLELRRLAREPGKIDVLRLQRAFGVVTAPVRVVEGERKLAAESARRRRLALQHGPDAAAVERAAVLALVHAGARAQRHREVAHSILEAHAPQLEDGRRPREIDVQCRALLHLRARAQLKGRFRRPGELLYREPDRRPRLEVRRDLPALPYP